MRNCPPPTAAEEASFDADFGLSAADRPRVAFIANFRRMKGHCDLIHALPRVLKEFPRLRILCAGRDDSLGEIPRLAREAGVDQALCLLGYCADTARILRHSDLMILPSLWEGCPNSVQEAMALGRPIITTRVGGIPEILESEKQGLLIPPQSPDALAEALLRLLRRPDEARALGCAARERAARDFPVDLMVRRLEAIYLWQLGQAPRPANL